MTKSSKKADEDTATEQAKAYRMQDLIAVMAKLRDPNGGCPWDLEQDFASIAPYTIEEAYEVADAIDRGDMKDLREELGDLLLQSVYHAQMAAESNDFTIHDVIHDVTDKMITRHPHVFGDTEAISAADVDKIWDERKAEEKAEAENKSALDGVAMGLPALLRAQKLQKKAGKVGFQWTEIQSVLSKLEEELHELNEAIDSKSLKEQEEELGDVLFVVANIGRVLGINAEEALRQANGKFMRRFNGMEEEFKAKNKDMKDASLEDMIAAWNVQREKDKER